mmetsp:Transcript_49885/g.125662  ORF Transcript_49885/g.125662 Transcript_49885/m.125662 type:complete len:331 (+) Transcript_49885:1416-2408(+)
MMLPSSLIGKAVHLCCESTLRTTKTACINILRGSDCRNRCTIFTAGSTLSWSMALSSGNCTRNASVCARASPSGVEATAQSTASGLGKDATPRRWTRACSKPEVTRTAGTICPASPRICCGVKASKSPRSASCILFGCSLRLLTTISTFCFIRWSMTWSSFAAVCCRVTWAGTSSMGDQSSRSRSKFTRQDGNWPSTSLPQGSRPSQIVPGLCTFLAWSCNLTAPAGATKCSGGASLCSCGCAFGGGGAAVLGGGGPVAGGTGPLPLPLPLAMAGGKGGAVPRGMMPLLLPLPFPLPCPGAGASGMPWSAMVSKWCRRASAERVFYNICA